jgi:uncharacterized membrane protein
MKKEDKKEKEGKNPETLGIAGFTLGIVSLSMLIFVPLAGILAGLTGLVFCIFQKKKKPTKKAKTGIILNIIGVVTNIIWWYVLAEFLYPLYFPAT